MRTVESTWQARDADRTIDVTPESWWRRSARKGVSGLGGVLAMPIVLLLGVVLLAIVLGGVGAILLFGWVRDGRRGRDRDVDHRRSDLDPPDHS